jgi:hypothetical protein
MLQHWDYPPGRQKSFREGFIADEFGLINASGRTTKPAGSFSQSFLQG